MTKICTCTCKILKIRKIRKIRKLTGTVLRILSLKKIQRPGPGPGPGPGHVSSLYTYRYARMP